MKTKIGLVPQWLSQLHESNYFPDYTHHSPSLLKNDSYTQLILFTNLNTSQGRIAALAFFCPVVCISFSHCLRLNLGWAFCGPEKHAQVYSVAKVLARPLLTRAGFPQNPPFPKTPSWKVKSCSG